MDQRQELVYLAKLAGEAERYDEMVDLMKKVTKLDFGLTTEEQNLLNIGFKKVTDAKRKSRRMLLSMEQEEEAKGNELNAKWTKEYKKKVESEIINICNDIVMLIDEHLLSGPACESESFVFYHKLKGDYYRYLAELKDGDEKEKAVNNSANAYEAGLDAAKVDLDPTNPLRLGLALNFSVLYYNIMHLAERAFFLAKEAYDEAIPQLGKLNEESYKDSTSILQVIGDNIRVWSFDF